MSEIVVKPDKLGTPKVTIKVNVTGGTDGATFTPTVSEDGVLSWSNNAGLENPAPVDVKGPKGDAGGVSSWNDLTDKPFYEADEEVTILPEDTYTIDADSGDAYILNPPSADVVVGNTYTVNWNGTEYSCIAQSFELDGVPIVVLGDIGAMTGGDSTGEPFVIIMFPADLAASVGAYGIIMALDGSASPTMSISTILETIHKLDNKYLDMAWVPTAEAKAEREFIPISDTNEAGNLIFQSGTVDASVLTEGVKVAVYIDDERHESTVSVIEGNAMFGNLSLISDGFPDTGENYAGIFHAEGHGTVKVVPSRVYSVSLCVFEYGTNKLPSDFIPDVVPTKEYLKRKLSERATVAYVDSAVKNKADKSDVPSNLVDGINGNNSLRTKSAHIEKDEYTLGEGAFAQGYQTKAPGKYANSEGIQTIAAGDYQRAQGKYNVEDSDGKYANIVGNGTGTAERSNAHTLDWDGNAWFAGVMEGTALILKSSTQGSAKRFKVTVDDTGTLTATEITE